MNETWRAIPGYEGHYEVSDQGRVRSFQRREPSILKGVVTDGGYHRVSLANGDTPRFWGVHQLVLSAFVGPRPDGLDTRHLDGDKLNNRLTNLAYGTHRENMLDEVRLGTHNNTRKTHCPRGHSYAENTLRFPSQPRARYCGACRSATTGARVLASP